MIILVLEEQTDHIKNLTTDLGNQRLRFISTDKHISFLQNLLIYKESWKNQVKK